MSNTNTGSNTSNHSLWNYASHIWKHSQKVIKGATLVTVGIVGYNFLTFFSSSKETKSDSSTISQATDLIEDKGLAKDSLVTTTNQLTHIVASSFASSEIQIDPAQTENLVKFDLNYPANKIDESNLDNNIMKKTNSKRAVNTPPIAVITGVNDVVIYNQQFPAVTSTSDGYIAGWESEGQDGYDRGVFIKKFDNYGTNLSSTEQANSKTVGDQKSISLSSFGDKVLAGWQSTIEGSSYDINAQWFNSSSLEKIGDELPLNDFNTVLSSAPKTDCSLVNNECTVVWYSILGTGFNYDVVAQRIKNLAKSGPSFVLNSANSEAQIDASVTYLDNNNSAFIWDSYAQDNSGWTVIGRIYNKTISYFGGEIVLPPYKTDNQWFSIIANMPTTNNVFVSWASNGQDGDGYGVYGVVYDYNFTPLTGGVQLNSETKGDQIPTSAVYLTKKIQALFVVWNDSNYNKVFGQLFDKNLNKIGRQFQVSSYKYVAEYAKVTELSTGNIVAVWHSQGQDGSGYGIFSRILIPDITLFIYNPKIPKTFTEDNTFQFTDLIVNPMVDADTINATLILSNPLAGSLSLESSNNITATFDATQGIWQVQNAGVVDLNRILEQLKFIPASNFNNDFTIQVDLTDSNNNHTSYSNTLNMLGVPVNDVPVLTTNQLALNQGDKITLSTNNINASDVDNSLADLSFKVDQLVQGQFENINNPGRGITTFTFSDLLNNEIIFIHDNTRFAPAYQMRVSDGNLTTSPQPAIIDFNARPELINNQLSIDGGQTVIMTQDNLKASDDHTAEGELVFMMNEVTHGQFEIVSVPGAAITQFTQQQIIDGQVQFTHDGSTQAPSFKSSVNDGRISSNPIPVTVNFVANNNSITANDTLALAIGVSIGGAALLAGAGIGIWQGKKQQQLRQEREQEPLANAVRTKLRVGNVDDFKSSQGRNYINFINTLKNELINLGIEAEQMLPDEINELAGFISNAIKETMKENGIKHKKTVTGAIELNTQTLQTYASTIAAKTQEYKNESQGLSPNGTALKTINPVVNV